MFPVLTENCVSFFEVIASSFLVFFFLGESERMGVKIEQGGKKPLIHQQTEIYFCTQSGFKWLENIKKSSPPLSYVNWD